MQNVPVLVSAIFPLFFYLKVGQLPLCNEISVAKGEDEDEDDLIGMYGPMGPPRIPARKQGFNGLREPALQHVIPFPLLTFSLIYNLYFFASCLFY
jgi:hypothetical protein